MLDGESEEQEWEPSWSGATGRVLLLDARAGGGVSAGLEAALLLLRRELAAGGAQLAGLALYATRRGDGRGLDHVAQLLELQRPGVEAVRQLQQLCADPDALQASWGQTDTCSLADALWQASKMFSYCKTKMNIQTVTILSNFPEPDPANHRSILKKASDLAALGIEVNLVNVSENEIGPDSFFGQLESIFSDEPPEEWIPPEPTTSPDEILPKIWTRAHKKSASAKLKMFLSPETFFGVGLYHLCKERSVPKKITLHRETNERIETKTNTFKANDIEEKPVLRAELCMCQNYGARNIEITYSEYVQLKKFGGDPSIKLLGFEPSSILTMTKRYLKPGAFLYPDELSVSGSTKLFRCLRDRCAEKNRVAICLMVSRWYSHPRLIALVPQRQITKGSRQIQPDGFHVIFLPYRDNLKDVAVEESVEVSEGRTLLARKIINKLKFEYGTENFENPKLQTLNDAIEALALDDSDRQPCEDSTLPDLITQRERLGPLSADFEELFGPFGGDNRSTKRKNSAEGGATQKRSAGSSMEVADIDILVGNVAQGRVDKYTVPQLKQILKWRNPPDLPALTGLKKNDLVNLVYQYCSNVTS